MKTIKIKTKTGKEFSVKVKTTLNVESNRKAFYFEELSNGEYQITWSNKEFCDVNDIEGIEIV